MTGGKLQAPLDFRRHPGLRGIEPQHFLRARKFAPGLGGRVLDLCVLLLLREFILLFHGVQADWSKKAANVFRARYSLPRTASADWPTSPAISS